MASITSRSAASRSAASRSEASPSVSASAASTRPTSVGSKQDDEVSTTRFTNVQDLFNVINCTPGDFLVVTHVSPSCFAEIERERDKRRRKFRFRRYDSSSQTLLITIPGDLHEQLHGGIYDKFTNQLARTGREDRWKSIRTATRQAQQGHPGGSEGQGDSTGGPKPERDPPGAWPTLVIEAGASESLAELHNDMRWWFSTSDHQVKIVLLVKFQRTGGVITLEKWEEESPGPPRPGATTTCHASLQQPVLRQAINITRDPTTNPVSYNVTSGALVFGFRLLFLRDPGPGEGDFVMSVPELEDYAKYIWTQL
ncbi:hypothetical protein C8A01DRAFT_48163 [Parachaetomium inaequale]|uniref:Uncharacterized protein n=1 Tax=Parachaetomium inaequale TaxID=2588326 RepID=A0AAN6PC10_9PEZI|nr:hypothetical protein C8A01DRAFT_48163 [Parachaetomium inaequale]